MRAVMTMKKGAVVTTTKVGRALMSRKQGGIVMSLKITQTFSAAFDVDYQAVLDRGTALGYTLPSAGQQVKQNQLVLDLKAADIWSRLDVFYVYATDGDQNYATLNWKSPSTFQCSRVNAPTFTANQGFTGNGSTMYLNTGFVPSSNGVKYTLNDASFGYYSSVAAPTGFMCGVLRPAGNSQVTMSGSNTQYWVNLTAGVASAGNATGQGFFHAKRTASNAMSLFRNGVSIGTTPSASTGLADGPFYALARFFAGAPNLFSNVQLGCLWIGGSANGLESSFYTAWNTYFSGL